MYWNACPFGAGGWPTCPAATWAFCCSTACTTSAADSFFAASLLRVEPQPHRVVALAEEGDVADALRAGPVRRGAGSWRSCSGTRARLPLLAFARRSGDVERLTIINWLGDFFLTVTPRRLTRSGRTGWARLTRFCTSTWAMFRSMPGLNVTVSV